MPLTAVILKTKNTRFLLETNNRVLNRDMSVIVEKISHLLKEASGNRDVVPQKNPKNIMDRICCQRRSFKKNVNKSNN